MGKPYAGVGPLFLCRSCRVGIGSGANHIVAVHIEPYVYRSGVVAGHTIFESVLYQGDKKLRGHIVVATVGEVYAVVHIAAAEPELHKRDIVFYKIGFLSQPHLRLVFI